MTKRRSASNMLARRSAKNMLASAPHHTSGIVIMLLLGSCVQLASAGGVGETVSISLAQPLLRGVRAWSGVNETTGTEPFLQAFINGQIVPYVNSCHVLQPDGEPDCDRIEGDCAENAAACEYVYAIESLVATGAIMGIIFAAAFMGCCLAGCCTSREYHPSWNADPVGCSIGGRVSKLHMSMSHIVPLLAGMVAVLTLLGFWIILELGGDVIQLLDAIKTATSVPADARARADWALLKISILQGDFLEQKAQLRVSPDEGLRYMKVYI
jgi:hypothetical protein